jgi:hypothetical protein
MGASLSEMNVYYYLKEDVLSKQLCSEKLRSRFRSL